MVVAGARALALLGAGLLLTGGVAPAVAASTPEDSSAAAASTSSDVAAQARKSRPGVWWYDAMHLDSIHRTATGKGVKVAVIDVQLDPYVPDLRGAKISKGTDCLDDKPTRYWSGRLGSHGTAMTTAIVGQGAGGKGIVGVAPDAEVRFWSYDYKPEAAPYECDAVLIANQVDKAVAWGADVINMSLGVGGGLEEAVGRALDSGAVVVASSGEVPDGVPRDEQPIEYPAKIPGVVAVVAADKDGEVWSKNPMGIQYETSKRNDWLGVMAPGVDTPLGGFRSTGGWVTAAPRTGTSGASALTAGAFAVLKERWPEATGNQLVQSVLHQAGGDDADGELSYDEQRGYGTLTLRNAMKVDPTGYPDENPLLLPPAKAIEAYPASDYDTSVASDQTSADEGDAAPQDGGAAAADTTGSSSDPASEESASVPWWAVALGVVLLAGAAAALLLRRRSASGPGPTGGSGGSEDHDTTYDHTAPRGS